MTGIQKGASLEENWSWLARDVAHGIYEQIQQFPDISNTSNPLHIWGRSAGVRFSITGMQMPGGGFDLRLEVGPKRSTVKSRTLHAATDDVIEKLVSGIRSSGNLSRHNPVPRRLREWRDQSNPRMDVWVYKDPIGTFQVSEKVGVPGKQNIQLNFLSDSDMWKYTSDIGSAQEAVDIAVSWYPVFNGADARDPRPAWKTASATEKVARTDADWKNLAEGLYRGMKRLSLPDVEQIRVSTKPGWKMVGKIGGVRFSVSGDMTSVGSYELQVEMAGRKAKFQAWNLFDVSERLETAVVHDLYRSVAQSANRIPASSRAASPLDTDESAARVASLHLAKSTKEAALGAANNTVLRNIKAVMNDPIYRKAVALANGPGGIEAALDLIKSHEPRRAGVHDRGSRS